MIEKNQIFCLSLFLIMFFLFFSAYANDFTYNSWYEVNNGRLLLELSENNSYCAVFVGKHGELITEEGLYRYSERSAKISFSPEFIKNRIKSPVYAEEFKIVSISEGTLEMQCVKDKSKFFLFVRDEHHLKNGCRCGLCGGKKGDKRKKDKR